MSRYAIIDLCLDRGAALSSDHGIVRGWVRGSTSSSLHSHGGFTIEQEIEHGSKDEHDCCRHFFTDSRFDARFGGDGDGIDMDMIHSKKMNRLSASG